jgi:hypothetical protein
MSYADSLRRQFPTMSNAMLTQILSSIEGIDTGKIQRLLLEQEGGVEAEIEYEMSQDGEGVNIITKPKFKRPAPASVPKPESEIDWHLSQDDLSILKPVPGRETDQQMSA